VVAQGPEAKLSESKHVLTLKQLEQDWLDSYREGDADKMGKILADDFIGRWADGSTQTKDEQLRAIQTGEEKHSTNRMVECNVRIYGGTAVVTGIRRNRAFLRGATVRVGIRIPTYSSSGMGIGRSWRRKLKGSGRSRRVRTRVRVIVCVRHVAAGFRRHIPSRRIV